MKKAPPAEGHNSKSIHPFTAIDRSIEREEEDLQLFSEVVLDLISSTGWKVRRNRGGRTCFFTRCAPNKNERKSSKLRER